MSHGRAVSLPLAEDQCFIRLKKQLIARTGLTYYINRDELLAEAIGRRLSELSLGDWSSYAEFLAKGAQGSVEMDALIAELTVGETYFFRDREQFEAIRRMVLPEILERNQTHRRLRVWSAGCANGAEPYTLAILLGRELAHRIAGWDIRIFATDINRRSLEEAGEGRFTEWAMRTIPDDVRRDCFSNDAGIWTIHPEYKRFIRFAQLNLVESRFPPLEHEIANFDLILCRNVMIYFGAETTRRLIAQFHESLADQGWFMVGAAEYNQDHFSIFHTVQAPGATVYQKTEKQAPQLPAAASWPPPRHRPALRPMAPGKPRASPPDARRHPDIDGLRRLADQGDWASAIRQCQELLVHHRLNPLVYFYRALVLEQMGILAESERSLRQTIYLDRNFVLAHYHLGVALQREKDPRRAERSFENAAKLLSGMPEEQHVLDEAGVTVGGLKELTKMHLENLHHS